LALALGISVLLATVMWFYPSSEDFRVDNPFWNGGKGVAAHFEGVPLRSLEDLPGEAEGTVLVEVPYTAYTEAELAAIESYVWGGGTIILADDYGYGNEVLDHLGLDARFAREPLLDPLFNYRNEWFPLVTDFSASPVTEDVEIVILNHATSLDTGPDIEAIARTSGSSFLDLNGNLDWDEGEPFGPMTIAARVEVGGGMVVLLADPSMVINSMRGLEDNERFVENMLEIGGPEPEILLDQSHLPEASLDEAKGIFRIARDALADPWGITGLVAVVLTATLMPIWRRRKGGSHG
jgi:hypothetical protein